MLKYKLEGGSLNNGIIKKILTIIKIVLTPTHFYFLIELNN